MQSLDAATPPPVAVATVLTSEERRHVDAAGQGVYRALHRESMSDLMRDLRRAPPAAVLISPHRCHGTDLVRVARMVREFPGIPAVAVVGGPPPSAHALVALGRSGVHTVVDVRQADGWAELRALVARERSRGIERRALTAIAEDLSAGAHGAMRFFETIFRDRGAVGTLRAICRQFEVVPSTFMSRFFRARLPAPKRYLAMARLVHAASLFENAGFSVASVAYQMEYSSPQSFGRHVRTLMGLTAQEFRDRYDGEGMLERYREELVRPHRATWRVFEPLG